MQLKFTFKRRKKKKSSKSSGHIIQEASTSVVLSVQIHLTELEIFHYMRENSELLAVPEKMSGDHQSQLSQETMDIKKTSQQSIQQLSRYLSLDLNGVLTGRLKKRATLPSLYWANTFHLSLVFQILRLFIDSTRTDVRIFGPPIKQENLRPGKTETLWCAGYC